MKHNYNCISAEKFLFFFLLAFIPVTYSFIPSSMVLLLLIYYY